MWFYHLCQFLYRTYRGITKKSRAISCQSLFPAWECKQTWLFPYFVPTVGFTSSQFPAYEKRHIGAAYCFVTILWCRIRWPHYPCRYEAKSNSHLFIFNVTYSVYSKLYEQFCFYHLVSKLYLYLLALILIKDYVSYEKKLASF